MRQKQPVVLVFYILLYWLKSEQFCDFTFFGADLSLNSSVTYILCCWLKSEQFCDFHILWCWLKSEQFCDITFFGTGLSLNTSVTLHSLVLA
jgi:hypothetical protein